MQELSSPQRNFVIAMVTTGAKNPTQAAMLAGFGGTDVATRVAAKVLMRNQKVLAAIREEADKRLRSGALLASSKLYELMENPDPKIALKASLAILDRSDLQVTTKHEVTVSRSQTKEDILRTVVELARRTGQDVKKLLGYDPNLPVIEAEFEDVPMSAEGLEDLL